MSVFEIYKRGQGRHVRMITFIAALVIIVSGCLLLSGMLGEYGVAVYLRFGAPTLLAAALAFLAFRAVNRQKSADFMIATESEMKKVSWSSKKEIIGSTKVVIVTTLIMAAVLYAVDIGFVLLFGWMGIMG